MHRECVHCRLGPGAVYCTRTRLVYLRPDLIPTPSGHKHRPDDVGIFSWKVKGLKHVLKPADPLGYILMNPKVPLPSNNKDILDVPTLLRWLRDQAEQQESNR